MRATRRAALAALGAALLLMSAGCVNSPLTAGTDCTMGLIVNPESLTFDPNQPASAQDVALVATLLNKDGVPQSGVTVIFSASVPGLASGNAGVKTDGSGNARDTLHVTSANAIADITVNATSGSLKNTFTIKVNTGTLNHPPTASILASPKTEQASGGSVVFDGSSSSDPDHGDSITMWKWVITSTNPDQANVPNQGDAPKDNPMIFEGPAVSGVSIPNDTLTPFRNVQDLNVQLEVTDDPGAPALFANHQPIAYRGQTLLQYSIVAVRCDNNTAPTAVLSGSTQQVVGFPQSNQAVRLDGSLSSDPESAQLQSYNFNCGNGTLPVAIPGLPSSKVNCFYTVDTVSRTYTATLVVQDTGTGQIVGGQYQCAKLSQPASIQITVIPLAGG